MGLCGFYPFSSFLGLAVAVTTGMGVYFWSYSFGLAGVISISMIILTTVTDVAGFFSFLGIATFLSSFL
jgi:magnesium transporter